MSSDYQLSNLWLIDAYGTQPIPTSIVSSNTYLSNLPDGTQLEIQPVTSGNLLIFLSKREHIMTYSEEDEFEYFLPVIRRYPGLIPIRSLPEVWPEPYPLDPYDTQLIQQLPIDELRIQFARIEELDSTEDPEGGEEWHQRCETWVTPDRVCYRGIYHRILEYHYNPQSARTPLIEQILAHLEDFFNDTEAESERSRHINSAAEVYHSQWARLEVQPDGDLNVLPVDGQYLWLPLGFDWEPLIKYYQGVDNNQLRHRLQQAGYPGPWSTIKPSPVIEAGWWQSSDLTDREMIDQAISRVSNWNLDDPGAIEQATEEVKQSATLITSGSDAYMQQLLRIVFAVKSHHPLFEGQNPSGVKQFYLTLTRSPLAYLFYPSPTPQMEIEIAGKRGLLPTRPDIHLVGQQVDGYYVTPTQQAVADRLGIEINQRSVRLTTPFMLFSQWDDSPGMGTVDLQELVYKFGTSLAGPRLSLPPQSPRSPRGSTSSTLPPSQ